MSAGTQSPKRCDNVVSSLNMAIDILNLAKEASSVTPAKAVFGSVSLLLAMIKVRSLLSRVVELQVHIFLGFYDKPNRLRRSWVDLF